MLQLSNSSTLLNDQLSNSDCSHPGDIYHPNFHLGHPAYFDLSVRCTTQSAIISKSCSSLQARMAAAACEVNLTCHLKKVESALLKEHWPLIHNRKT